MILLLQGSVTPITHKLLYEKRNSNYENEFINCQNILLTQPELIGLTHRNNSDDHLTVPERLVINLL